MKSMKLFSVLMVLLLAVVAVSGVSAQDLGSEDNPIQVYFVPSVDVAVIVTGGDIMADALQSATGLHFEVSVPTSYAATIEAMCADPGRSMGFIPARGYVEANNLCGVEVEAAAVRFGWPVYWAQYIVRRDSDIYVFGDLAGKTWAVPSLTSTSGYLYPAAELREVGIEVGEIVEVGGHPQAVLAVARGEVDFATTFFSPPEMPGAQWNFGDVPEPYDLTVDDTYIGEDGELYVGDIVITDARAAARETLPDVVEQVRILRLTAPIPNDTLSFGPEFPEELRDDIIDALIAFSETEEWAESIGNRDFYDWSSLTRVSDATYDPIRLLIAAEQED
jgi:phosphonate transport system substrate-binding protein